ncbi:putative soluble lytic transglycosylase fused to an ABC-type amino acid-binding protein [Polaromonas sp. CF318]|uniref:lytic transglycosylase domain-containing protein n=1 Tax=Polaromonas sp. CF318 TaxID=1144318 RepID=UPI000271184F|nr:lytic transglycosylase domain-containing protein [Polaromonas sp. CF318]EJL77853.1 putative soluble lytic transglycosylase fused to an ABC-type amino acid-binding protein [Polaromonas sp. CF318]
MPSPTYLFPAGAAGLAAALLLASPAAPCSVLEIGADGAVLVRAADRVRAAATGATAAMPAAWRPQLERIAARHALSPALVEALVWQESRWNTGALSPKGAIGLAQLMPDTARELGVDPHDPLDNLEGGARYLRQQMDRFGDLPSALAAYNAGPARVAAAGGVPDIAETRDYVNAVLGRITASAAAPGTTPTHSTHSTHPATSINPQKGILHVP